MTVYLTQKRYTSLPETTVPPLPKLLAGLCSRSSTSAAGESVTVSARDNAAPEAEASRASTVVATFLIAFINAPLEAIRLSESIRLEAVL